MARTGCRNNGAGYFGRCRCHFRRAGRKPLSGGDAPRICTDDFGRDGPGDTYRSLLPEWWRSVRAFEELLQDAGVVVVPLDDSMANEAFAAFRRFGKGRGHPAQLNIIDCVAYALAKNRREALLFKGNDFATPDVESAL